MPSLEKEHFCTDLVHLYPETTVCRMYTLGLKGMFTALEGNIVCNLPIGLSAGCSMALPSPLWWPSYLWEKQNGWGNSL